MCFAVIAVSCSGKKNEKKNEPVELSNPMAERFLKAQASDSPAKTEQAENKPAPAPVTSVNPLEIICFNRENAVVDNGKKAFKERKNYYYR